MVPVRAKYAHRQRLYLQCERLLSVEIKTSLYLFQMEEDQDNQDYSPEQSSQSDLGIQTNPANQTKVYRLIQPIGLRYTD